MSTTRNKIRPTPEVQAEPGGQGAAFRQVGETGARILVVTVVNALGVIVDRENRIVRGCYNPARDVRLHPRDVMEPTPATGTPAATGAPTENTTITAVVTNQKLSPLALAQLGRQVHASMSRAIQPFHTPRDGDVLFTLSTETLAEGTIDEFALAEIASDVAWDAVLSSVGHS